MLFRAMSSTNAFFIDENTSIAIQELSFSLLLTEFLPVFVPTIKSCRMGVQ